MLSDRVLKIIQNVIIAGEEAAMGLSKWRVDIGKSMFMYLLGFIRILT
jgi:hypothetical protein